MTQRLAIGAAIRAALPGLGKVAAQIVRGAAAVTVGEWIQQHRAELVEAVQQADEQRGSQLLHQLCAEFPPAAFAVELAMSGSPESAIDALAMFDAELAHELERYRPNFEKLQTYWRSEKQ